MGPGDITKLIVEWQRGNKTAENELFEALYTRLHGIALQILRAERPGISIGPTGLLHEAYLRFQKSERLEIADRSHFLALSARVMRRILVDRARAKRTEKRDGQHVPAEWADQFVQSEQQADQILGVDRALDLLSASAPRQCRLVELRYFAGFSIEESATILGISARTARREWQVARTRLLGALDGTQS
jgi:RNA polymerase sigma factor (TIGR02999 family)